MNNKFEKWLQANEWQVEVHLSSFDCSKIDVLKRFRNVPDSFLHFLEHFKSITSKDDTTWFICGGDYNDDSDDAFKWNEYELMSLEAAESDSDWKKDIEKWWSDKLPFLMSVKDGYSFYAIDLGENNGAIIKGEEPEFEEAYIVADNFEDFLEKVMNNAVIL